MPHGQLMLEAGLHQLHEKSGVSMHSCLQSKKSSGGEIIR